MPKLYHLLLIMVVFLILVLMVQAIDEDMPPAIIVNDEGGVQVVQGEISYTWPLFAGLASNGFIYLEDQTGFVNREYYYAIPFKSQVIGQITSNIYQSPFTYSLQLPAVPQAPLNDVDHDNEDDIGVQIFQIAYSINLVGDIYVEERDMYGWTNNYSSAAMDSEPPERINEYIGGKLLIYAPVEGQAFPSGFGEDELLFSDDDPLVIVPQGYTLVDMNMAEFTFDRSRTVQVDLIEDEESEPQDASDLSYSEAFDELVAYFSERYSFTEHKNIDWDALHAEYRPRFEEAWEEDDIVLYALAMRDFEWEFYDQHASMGKGSWRTILNEQFAEEISGGMGLAIRETTDGRVIVDFLLEGAPADEAGIQLGAEIIEINGTPILDAIENTIPWSLPFSTVHPLRLQQLRYVIRFPLGEEVELTYRNPDANQEETVNLETIDEIESFNHSSFFNGVERVIQPIEWRLVEDYFYVHINTFSGDPHLILELWEQMLAEARANRIGGLILDMRDNSGGLTILSNLMAGYFFEENLIRGYSNNYEESLGEFYFDEQFPDEIQVPPEEQVYKGDVVLIISHTCISACERFTFNMTLQNRATLIGYSPTAGASGGYSNIFIMPENFTVILPTYRTEDIEHNILIEGQGVPPDILVPINEDTLGLTDAEYFNNDPLLDEAIGFLKSGAGRQIIDGGEIGYEEEITDTLNTNERVRYTFTIEADVDPVGIYIVSEMDTYLRIYDEMGANLVIENDDFAGTDNSGITGISLDREATIIIEVAAANDNQRGEYMLIVKGGEHPFEVVTETIGKITIGETLSGELIAGVRHAYTLELEAEQLVNISVAGLSNLDTQLRIYDEDGELIAENDDADDDTPDPLIDGFSLPEDGTVTIVIGSFVDSLEGQYELTVEATE